MARGKKKRSRKQGWFSKIANVFLWGVAFARPIIIAFGPGSPQAKFEKVIREATFGLVAEGGQVGTFNLNEGLAMYLPAGAAMALSKIKGFAARHFPVRG